MSMGGGELMVLLILFLLLFGVIGVIVVVITKALQWSNNRNGVTKPTVEIDREIHAELTRIAARDGVTVHRMVGDLLYEYVTTRR